LRSEILAARPNNPADADAGDRAPLLQDELVEANARATIAALARTGVVVSLESVLRLSRVFSHSAAAFSDFIANPLPPDLDKILGTARNLVVAANFSATQPTQESMTKLWSVLCPSGGVHIAYTDAANFLLSSTIGSDAAKAKVIMDDFFAKHGMRLVLCLRLLLEDSLYSSWNANATLKSGESADFLSREVCGSKRLILYSVYAN
jgi:hypothetical protein